MFTHKRLALFSAALILVMAVMLAIAGGAETADAAKPLHAQGKGKGGNGGGNGATLVVTPNPAESGSYITISGSGFRSNTDVQVGVSGYIPFYVVTTDSSGSFVFAYPRAVMGPCECKVEAWGTKGLLASTVLTVFAP